MIVPVVRDQVLMAVMVEIDDNFRDHPSRRWPQDIITERAVFASQVENQIVARPNDQVGMPVLVEITRVQARWKSRDVHRTNPRQRGAASCTQPGR